MSHTSRLAAMAAVALMAASPGAGEWVPPLWKTSGTTKAPKAPRSKSSHKQNARKQRKARK